VPNPPGPSAFRCRRSRDGRALNQSALGSRRIVHSMRSPKSNRQDSISVIGGLGKTPEHLTRLCARARQRKGFASERVSGAPVVGEGFSRTADDIGWPADSVHPCLHQHNANAIGQRASHKACRGAKGNAGTTFDPACSFLMLSRAQWYRDQAALAVQRGHETRSPYLRAGYDELGREWLRLAEQAEWIANQQQPPLTGGATRRKNPGLRPVPRPP
jgi:hypothetical protein